MDGLWSPVFMEDGASSNGRSMSMSQRSMSMSQRSMSMSQRALSFSMPQSPTTKVKYKGKRIAQIVRLKKDRVKEYKECHAKVWPEVLRQIKLCNIEDYSIFYDDATSILFANFRYVGYDWEGDMAKMRENEKVREWWKMTDSYQESMVPGAISSEQAGVDGVPGWWKGIEEVFYNE